MKRTTLIAARRNAGLTQEQMANEVGLWPGSYCWYETGKTTPKVDAAIRIAKVLGINTFDGFCQMFDSTGDEG